MKTIQLIDIKIHEVQISFTPEPSLNVLYSLLDKNGREYSRQWRIVSGRKIDSILDKITRVMERAIESVKEEEGL
jgi:hypothetical protein